MRQTTDLSDSDLFQPYWLIEQLGKDFPRLFDRSETIGPHTIKFELADIFAESTVREILCSDPEELQAAVGLLVSIDSIRREEDLLVGHLESVRFLVSFLFLIYSKMRF